MEKLLLFVEIHQLKNTDLAYQPKLEIPRNTVYEIRKNTRDFIRGMNFERLFLFLVDASSLQKV